MKRLLTLAYMMLAIVGVSLFAPQAKAAYVEPYSPPGAGCQQVSETSGTYPYFKTGLPPGSGWYLYCGSKPTTYEPSVGQTLSGLPWQTGTSNVRGKLQTANVAVYVFPDCATSKKYLGAAQPANACPTTGGPVYGFSTLNVVAPMTTPIMVVWENVYVNGKLTPQTQTLIAGAIRHEAGHQIDHIWGTLSTKNNPPTQPMLTLMKNDFAHAPANVVSYYKTYYPFYFAPAGGSNPEWSELFAEEFAIAAGGGIDPTNMDTALNYWICSSEYLKNLEVQGVAPPAYSEPYCLNP